MDVPIISMDTATAQDHFNQYAAAVRERQDNEYRLIMNCYKALAKHGAIININEAIRQGGLGDDRLPKLAICRADAKKCYLHKNDLNSLRYCMDRSPENHWSRRFITVKGVEFMDAVHPDLRSWGARFSALVPIIPPQFMPKAALSNFHILWEAEWSKEPPVDPILLRRIEGPMFSVLAHWDLTEVEREILRGRSQS